MVLTSGLGIGLGCCGASVLLAFAGVAGWFDNNAFKARALQATGDVVRASDGAGRVFRFDTPQGTIALPVRPRSHFYRDPIGAHIAVFYDPSNPKRLRRARDFRPQDSQGMELVYSSPVLLLAGVVIVVVDRRNVRKKWAAIDALADNGITLSRAALHTVFTS
jgi:hypothetical protein